MISLNYTHFHECEDMVNIMMTLL